MTLAACRERAAELSASLRLAAERGAVPDALAMEGILGLQALTVALNECDPALLSLLRIADQPQQMPLRSRGRLLPPAA